MAAVACEDGIFIRQKNDKILQKLEIQHTLCHSLAQGAFNFAAEKLEEFQIF